MASLETPALAEDSALKESTWRGNWEMIPRELEFMAPGSFGLPDLYDADSRFKGEELASSTAPLVPFGKEVDDVTLLTALDFKEEVSSFATPWVPPLESPFGPPGGATRVSFWETGGFFTAEPGTGLLADCPVEGGCTPGSRFPEVELWTGVPPEEELPEETPCLETELAKGLFL